MSNSEFDLSKLRIEKGVQAEPQAKTSSRGMPSKIIFGLSIAVFFSVGFFVARLSHHDQASSSDKPTDQVVSVSAPTSMSSTNSLTASGYVVAQRHAAVASKGTGRLKELFVREGDTVKANQIIAILENDDLAASVRQLEAQLAVARSKVVTAQAELTDAQSDVTRTRALRAAKAVSQSDLDKAEARFSKASSELVGTKASVDLAEAQLARASIELDYTSIRAPFDGTVLSKNADVGEIVAPFGSSTNARAAVVTIADMDSLEIEADVAESNIARISVGQPCEITLDSFPGKRYRGEVSKIVPTVDRAKATIMTKIKFLERDSSVLPEMSAKVFFKNG